MRKRVYYVKLSQWPHAVIKKHKEDKVIEPLSFALALRELSKSEFVQKFCDGFAMGFAAVSLAAAVGAGVFYCAGKYLGVL